MGQGLRNCEMEITQALRNSKLDPKTFKEGIIKSLDSAGRFFSNHLKMKRLKSWKSFNSSCYNWTENIIFLSQYIPLNKV